MIGLRISALLVVVAGLGGCVVPYDDGREGNYYRSGYSNNAGPSWRDDPQRYERRRYDEQRFGPYGERRYDQR
jgi:hypothetical protein